MSWASQVFVLILIAILGGGITVDDWYFYIPGAIIFPVCLGLYFYDRRKGGGESRYSLSTSRFVNFAESFVLVILCLLAVGVVTLLSKLLFGTWP